MNKRFNIARYCLLLTVIFMTACSNHQRIIDDFSQIENLPSQQYHYVIDWHGENPQQLSTVLELSDQQAVLVGMSLNGLTLFSAQRESKKITVNKRYGASKDLPPADLLEQCLLIQLPLLALEENMLKQWQLQSDASNTQRRLLFKGKKKMLIDFNEADKTATVTLFNQYDDVQYYYTSRLVMVEDI